ncbi:hypothetical protein C9417_29860 [Rhizobium sp. SEMIA 4088]|nr:hypothetical protein C9417_29860 [Rhizobium sp. SEMIA 4088]
MSHELSGKPYRSFCRPKPRSSHPPCSTAGTPCNRCRRRLHSLFLEHFRFSSNREARYLPVFTQFQTQNRVALLLELL